MPLKRVGSCVENDYRTTSWRPVGIQILLKPSVRWRRCKEMFNYARDHSVADSLNYVATWTAATLLGGNDLREGVLAFREKREATYDNLLPIDRDNRLRDD